MKLPKLARKAVRAVLGAMPAVERRLLPSAGYRLLREGEGEVKPSASGWQSRRAVVRQQRIYDRLLAELRAGRPREDFVIAARAVDEAALQNPTLLETGCGSGYHSEVFAALCASRPRYVGSDYSQAMLDEAALRYPMTTFHLADTTALPFKDEAFDVVFEGVALMHIPNYPAAVREVARVARSHAIFHSVPVFEDHPTCKLFKYAYGAPVSETVFNRTEFEELLYGNGLTIANSWHTLDYDVSRVAGRSHARTYLCVKGRPA